MKFFKIAAISVIAFTGLTLVIGFILPSHWSVERSVVIHAPPKVIYPYISNFKTGWPEFSEFERQDPNVTYTYAGPDEGLGAVRIWSSVQLGDGQQKMIKADPESGVQFELKVVKSGFLLIGELKMEPQTGGATKVTWKDQGDAGSNILFRYIAMFMDRSMGEMFEISLDRLKRKAEVKSALTK